MENSIVDIGGKRTLEYLVSCLSELNKEDEKVTIRAIGGSVSKGVRVVQILTNYFNFIEIEDTRMSLMEIEKTTTSCLEFSLKSIPGEKDNTTPVIEDVFLHDKTGYGRYIATYPLYHLLFDNLLYQKKKLNIYYQENSSNDVWSDLLEISMTAHGIECIQNIKEDNKDTPRKLFKDFLQPAYYRSGLLVPGNWKEIAKRLSQFDDIILAVDTNILLDAVLSEHFLDSIYLIDPKEYIHTPNWLLVVIPSAVMHELEQATNSRDEKGLLSRVGRVGFRALGEILELVQSIDLPGISVIVFGEYDPVLDLRVEMQGLRKDTAKVGNIKSSPKSSTGDTIIRDQFKHFLRQVDFYTGGAFFLTADKTNAALARAEGIHSVYCKNPHWAEANKSVSPYSIKCNSGADEFTIPVPLGKLIYELSVQFGSIRIGFENSDNSDRKIEISCDRKGEILDHWVNKNLMIRRMDAEELLKNYNGRFSLNYVREMWGSLNENLVNIDIY